MLLITSRFVFIMSFSIAFLVSHYPEISFSQTLKLKGENNYNQKLESIKTTKANLRSGPGKKYPIQWIYIKKGFPLKIIAEFEHWKKVSTFDNTIGWLHKSQVSSKKTSIIIKSDYLRKKPKLKNKKLAYLKKNLIVDIIYCKVYWCKIKLIDKNNNGWFIKKNLWADYLLDRY